MSKKLSNRELIDLVNIQMDDLGQIEPAECFELIKRFTEVNQRFEDGDELQRMLTHPEDVEPLVGKSEAAVSNAVRLEASEKGVRLYRNNVGACQDKSGRLVRYGWMNDSKQMNERIKSGDLIGIRPVLITPDMVGTTIGQFVMREVKKGDWTFKATPHEMAQLRCIEFVVSLGGDACFANGRGTL